MRDYPLNLSHLSEWPPARCKRWNSGCSQKRSPKQLCRLTSPDLDRSHSGLPTTR